MIEGVLIKKLKAIYDERGHLMEILRNDDELFETFGQVYITTAKPGIIKGWHYHALQDDHFCCVYGKILLALYDARDGSPTKGELAEFELSIEEPKVVRIPKGVYHGFTAISCEEAIVVNVPTMPYNRETPDEYRVDAFDKTIGYNWRRQ